MNPIDIAPKYAGILMGISNSAATIAGIIAPQVAKGIASSNVSVLGKSISNICIPVCRSVRHTMF